MNYKIFEFSLAKNYIETDEYDRGERMLGVLLIELEKLVENPNDTTHAISNYNPIYFSLLLNRILVKCVNNYYLYLK